MNGPLRLLELTLSTPAENLALDEALLEEAEQHHESIPPGFSGWLRIWEAPTPLVVVGRGSRVDQEVDRTACDTAQIPILRRCSGGTAILAGPGCLMYALVVSYRLFPELRPVDQTHAWVMQHLSNGLSHLEPKIEFLGTCDLTLRNQKFSGNSLRCRRDHFLYHGTILYDFDLARIASFLRRPPREPDYRNGRHHQAFLTNFPHRRQAIRDALVNHWNAQPTSGGWPELRTKDLASKYEDRAWNFRLE
jgi:lipoate-protein ligase A